MGQLRERGELNPGPHIYTYMHEGRYPHLRQPASAIYVIYTNLKRGMRLCSTSMAGKPAFVRARLAPSVQAESLAWKSGGMRHVWEWGKAPWASYIQLISCFGQTCFPYVKFTCVSLHIYVKFTCVNLHI